MPKACGFVDFKTVMFFQLELTPAVICSSVTPGMGIPLSYLNDSRPQDFRLIGAFPRKLRPAEMSIGGGPSISW